MAKINDVCDYIILQLAENPDSPSLLKIQKLLYYVQAWHWAFYGREIFKGKFQAWIHGPVNREIYDRFVETKYLYSPINLTDLQSNFNPDEALTTEEKKHINNVLEVYAPFSGTELEDLTHNEEPWQKARNGYTSIQRCEVEIDENLMESYYKNRISK